MHTEIFAHSLSTPLPTPPTHTVDTEKQQTILFSIETVIQGICAKDGRLFSQRRLFQIMNERLFGTQTIESQSRSNFVGFFSFLLYCWTFRRNYPSGLSVCCLCVCVCRARGGRMNFVIVDVVRHSFRCRLSKMGNALKCCPVGNG